MTMTKKGLFSVANEKKTIKFLKNGLKNAGIA